MSNIAKYANIIRVQTRQLVDSDQTYLTKAQSTAIERIHMYTEQLAFTATCGAESHEEQKAVRHELINILTPVMGYIEMLADGWIGQLNPDQMSHVEILQYAVQSLRLIILAHPVSNGQNQLKRR